MEIGIWVEKLLEELVEWLVVEAQAVELPEQVFAPVERQGHAWGRGREHSSSLRQRW